MLSWEWILAWVLYLAFVGLIAYRRSTIVNAFTPLLNETDWVIFWIYVIWWIGVGVLATALII